MDTDETIKLNGGRQRVDATNSDLSGSTFNDVNLIGSTFKEVNFAGTTIADASLSGCRIDNAALTGMRISNSTLSGTAIVDCVVEEMTIDGVPVTDLIAAYRAAKAE